MYYKKIIILIFILILSTTKVTAQSNLDLEVGQLDGTTRYIISTLEDGGIKSELIFPLKTKIVSLKYGQELPNTILGVKKINLSLMKNINTNNNGLMKDSDWFYAWGFKKDIYSETKADLKALGYKIEFNSPQYTTENINYSFNSGYKYNNFDYNVHDGIQYNYATDEEVQFSGKVLEYEVKYHIPYFGVEFSNHEAQTLNWNLNFNLAPYIKAEDIDDHILRYKKSTGSAEGSGYFLDGSLTYNLSSNLSILLTVEYNKFNTDGHQDQYFYGGKDKGQKNNNIDQEINLKSHKISTKLNYYF